MKHPLKGLLLATWQAINGCHPASDTACLLSTPPAHVISNWNRGPESPPTYLSQPIYTVVSLESGQRSYGSRYWFSKGKRFNASPLPLLATSCLTPTGRRELSRSALCLVGRRIWLFLHLWRCGLSYGRQASLCPPQFDTQPC